MPTRPLTPDEKAYRAALRLLRVQDRSTAELRARLAKFPPAAVERTIARLVASNLLNDDALARRIADAAGERGESHALMRDRARRRSLPARAAARAIHAAPTDAALALAAARAAAARLPASLDAHARWRRVLGALARRGHDAEASLDAARAVLGEPPDPSDAHPSDADSATL
ncbi:MAG: RecX family transcriptional regulator [Planctomycetota bacterium]|nr:RecX family transcriptional regulator [Planctomycetota bacterium]